MLSGSPLACKFKINRDRTETAQTKFLRPLCKEDGKKGDGTNPAILVALMSTISIKQQNFMI
ncbi:hypothetical protein [Clostridium sp. Marseille-Q7071]